MSKIRIEGYEVEFRKARDEADERDLTVRRVDKFTEVFILIGHFKKVADCKRVYVEIEIDGGGSVKKKGKWIDYSTEQEKDELFFTGDVEIGTESASVDIRVISTDKPQTALRLILESH